MNAFRQVKLQSHHKVRARQVAQHEMAHYVVARAVGFRTGDVSIKITGHSGHHGAATIFLAQPVGSLEDVASFLERRVLVLCAGALGETLSASHVPERGVNGAEAVKIIRGGMGAEQDHAKAREAISLLRNIQNPGTCGEDEIQAQLDEIDQRLWSRATELVELFESTIAGVAGALLERLEFVDIAATFSADYLEDIPAIKEIPSLAP